MRLNLTSRANDDTGLNSTNGRMRALRRVRRTRIQIMDQMSPAPATKNPDAESDAGDCSGSSYVLGGRS